MHLLRALRRRLRGDAGLATLGRVDLPREVSLIGVVVDATDVRSPVSSRRCAYYHVEIGQTVELHFPALRRAADRHTFRPFAELKSQADVVIRTADGAYVLLPGGYFIVRGTEAARQGKPLPEIPEALRALVGGRPIELTKVGYREIALQSGDRVRFAGTVEPVVTEARAGYRGPPRRSLRMRPEREPIVVEAVP